MYIVLMKYMKSQALTKGSKCRPKIKRYRLRILRMIYGPTLGEEGITSLVGKTALG